MRHFTRLKFLTVCFRKINPPDGISGFGANKRKAWIFQSGLASPMKSVPVIKFRSSTSWPRLKVRSADSRRYGNLDRRAILLQRSISQDLHRHFTASRIVRRATGFKLIDESSNGTFVKARRSGKLPQRRMLSCSPRVGPKVSFSAASLKRLPKLRLSPSGCQFAAEAPAQPVTPPRPPHAAPAFSSPEPAEVIGRESSGPFDHTIRSHPALF